jgi:predicted hotdog family 3-hydroxylacyl-ACP dehydratase
VLIDKTEITRLIPHSGAMCLLDGVLGWDVTRIQCQAATHRSAINPLRRAGRLGILCGVEYAAQAMALHAALAGDATGRPRRGYLASLRALSCHHDRLDLLPGALLIEVERLHGDVDRVIYSFAVRHEDQVLLDGRAAVVLEPPTA